jgi:hypothetical protein
MVSNRSKKPGQDGEGMAHLGGSGFNVHSLVRAKTKPEAVLRIVEEELRRLPSKGWAAMIRKVYEVDPMICSKCGGRMKVVAFLADAAVVDRIISHLKLTFVADRPPPRLTSPAGRNIVVDEVRMGSQVDSERVLSSGQKRNFLSFLVFGEGVQDRTGSSYDVLKFAGLILTR